MQKQCRIFFCLYRIAARGTNTFHMINRWGVCICLRYWQPACQHMQLAFRRNGARPLRPFVLRSRITSSTRRSVRRSSRRLAQTSSRHLLQSKNLRYKLARKRYWTPLDFGFLSFGRMVATLADGACCFALLLTWPPDFPPGLIRVRPGERTDDEAITV